MNDFKQIDNTLDRCSLFQQMQIWPLSSELDYNGWLRNFSKEELPIAKRILNAFIYFPQPMINQMLISAVGYAGKVIKSIYSDWCHDDFKNRCWYSYVPGEHPNSSDSGFNFQRILKKSLSIPESRLLFFDDLVNKMRKEKDLIIILVDDFVGSGEQCINMWNQIEGTIHANGHLVIYAPLVVNCKGEEEIRKICSDIYLTPAHFIGLEYNLFDKTCRCWDDEDSYQKGISLITEKSRLIGIPMDDETNTSYYKGFFSQGLSLAFCHGAPDAILPIFYWQDNNWNPLINKTYHR